MKIATLKLPTLALAAMLAAGCASNSDLEEVRAEAAQAQRTADEAKATAQQAQQTADDAKRAADEANTRIDRAFQKSMYK